MTNCLDQLPKCKFPKGIDFGLPFGNISAMDKLLEYLNSLATKDRADFCLAAGTSENYLRKTVSLGGRFKAELCSAIEKASQGEVTRRDLRPDDWQDIWPELAEKAE
jgi:DNA-binding transcriptional regulator YdaS (Cro superfamily)